MLHEHGTIGNDRGFTAPTSSLAPAGREMFRSGPSAPPLILMLWAIGEEFFTTSFCPSRITVYRGMNAHMGWSRSTTLSWSALGVGIRPVGFLASTSQKTTFLTPFVFGSMTSSFLRIAPFSRQCSLSLSTFASSFLGIVLSDQITWLLTDPWASAAGAVT